MTVVSRSPTSYTVFSSATTLKLVPTLIVMIISAVVGAKGSIELLAILVIAIPLAFIAWLLPQLPIAVYVAGMAIWAIIPTDFYERFAGKTLVLTLLLAIIVHALRGRIKLPQPSWMIDVFMLELGSYLFMGIAWSPAWNYAVFKSLLFVMSGIVMSLLVRSAYGQAPHQLWMLVRLVALLGLLPFVVTVIASMQIQDFWPGSNLRIAYFLTQSRFQYFGLSDEVGVSLPAAFAMWIQARGRKATGRFWAVFTAAQFWTALALGQRSQLFGSILAMVILWWRRDLISGEHQVRGPRALRRYSELVLFSGGLLTLAFAFTGKLKPEYLAHDPNIIGRANLYETAWRYFLQNPIVGNGTGSFPILTFNVDVRVFVHNILLESLAEGGILQFSLLMGFLIACADVARWILHGRKAELSYLGVIAIALFANRLIVAMLSADLGYWNMGVWLGMMLVVYGASSTPEGRRDNYGSIQEDNDTIRRI